MQISDKGLALIKRFEGCILHAYLCPAKVWTIGYGHTGHDVKQGLTITPEQAEELLKADLLRFEDAVEKSGAFTQHQFDACVAFAFNVGINAFKASTLLKLHRAGDFAGATGQFGRWNKGGGVVLPGLMKRRAAEAELYAS